MHRIVIPVLMAAVAAFAIAACHKQPANPNPAGQNPNAQIQQGANQMSQGVKAAVSDSAITAQVKAKLAANAGLESADIHVETNNGVVTLTGTVDRIGLKDMAARTAHSVNGVKRIVNQIEVKPPSGG